MNLIVVHSWTYVGVHWRVVKEHDVARIEYFHAHSTWLCVHLPLAIIAGITSALDARMPLMPIEEIGT